ncbi:MAG: VWA domain-containing protein [Candidatus Thorarchaeota archaeon]
MKLRPRRGRNQQGFCFVSKETIDSKIETFELTCGSNFVYSDIRGSDKVSEGVIILDSRIHDILDCDDAEEIQLVPLSDKIPVCKEIHLDVISERALENQTVAHAISERIDDFQDHFEGLVLRQGQELSISELGVSFLVRSMSPTDSTTGAARIVWKQLLKIHLGAVESQPTNLCIIVEVAAATQIIDVQLGADDGEPNYLTRHHAILQTLEAMERRYQSYEIDAQFAGIVFSDEVLPFITFDPQTGEENEITNLHSSSLIGAFRKWVGTVLDEFSNRPSNPGAALRSGLEKAQSLCDKNGLPTTIVFFSSGVYSAGQNPVKVTRTNIEDLDVRILSISVGVDSATDIMEAIAKEGSGRAIHLDSVTKMNPIVDTINNMTTSQG